MSGRITIDNLSDSLKEMISNGGLSEEEVLNLINENGLSEEQVLNLINENGLSEEQVIDLVKNNLTGDISQLSTQEKGSLVGAINELFQSANNGKELIANAIGEPLDSNDTFSAMSNDINSLLSTFKTNMMNNGITVESSDKFKSLIDKIATLADSEGSGIQFASGTYTTSGGKTYLSSTDITVPMNLSFDPTYVFVESSFVAYDTSYEYRPRTLGLISNIRKLSLDRNSEDSNNDTRYSEIYLTNITRNSCKIDGNGSGITVDAGTYNWYAIGVGEEDTTLRDSLASILQEEGVSVTEEDDMADLITKVDEEFDRQVVPAGNAVAANVDKGKTFINSTGQLVTGTSTKVSPAGTAVAADVSSGKTFINSTGQLVTGTSTKVSPAGTAVAADVLSGKTFINSTGQTITGTMANRGSKTITPSSSTQTLSSGYYSGITIKAVSSSSSGSAFCKTTATTVTFSGKNTYADVSCSFGKTPSRILLIITNATAGSYSDNYVDYVDSYYHYDDYEYYSWQYPQAAGIAHRASMYIENISSTGFRICIDGLTPGSATITIGTIFAY